jgi:choline dehydrogenase-like flavoprotein
LGGTSAINFLFWTHVSQQNINDWGELRNANWSWKALEPYYTKSEAYINPSKVVVNDLQTQYIEPSLHGKEVPILNTFPDIYRRLDEAWPQTYETLGLKPKTDPRDGPVLGGHTNLINIDPKGRTRSYAAMAYYLPAVKRPNLRVVTGALVKKILLKKSSEGRIQATDVQYSTKAETFEVRASKEVILNAGSIGSPQILEVSGIGSRSVLSKYGIETLVEDKNVGENLQDHIYVPIT